MKKFVPIVLVVLLMFTALNSNWMHLSAESIDDLDQQIRDLEKEQEELKEQESSLDSEKSDTEKKLEENVNQQNTVRGEIDSIDQQLAETETSIQVKENEIQETNQEIESLNNQIDTLIDQIEELEDEIIELEEKIDRREELLVDRLRTIQKNGGTMRYIEVLLGSSSFSDFISRTAAVNIMMDQDKAIMESFKEDQITVEHKKTEVEENKTEVEDKKVEVEDQKLALEGQRQELVSLQGQLDEQMSEKERLMAQLEQEHEQLKEIELSLEEEQEILRAEADAKQKAIAMAERKKSELEQLNKEEETKQQTEHSSLGNPEGIFILPAEGRITSHFGMRFHPIHHENTLHAGTDFATPTGTPLRAPADGVVSEARWRGGFGNVIFISHYINGRSYTTVSAHLSRMDVSPGQEVTEGQVIGATGNTGDSTGPHLHFEVHLGGYGNPVDPLPYLK